MSRTLSASIFCLCLSVFSTLLLSKDNSPAKLAIVDAGTPEIIPSAFIDSLLVAFNKYPEIKALERADIDKILKEQFLSLSLSNADAMKVGKLWAVDAFLMLELKKSGPGTSLRVRLVDTRYGFKIWDSSLAFSNRAEDLHAQARLLAGSAAQNIRKPRVNPKQLTILGVSSFRNEEPSARWDWLSDALASGIEQNLALYRGIILAERTKTQPLIRERDLVAGLPESIRPSTVFIDGSFKLNREQGVDAISVYLRCRRQNKILLETRINGSIKNEGKLYRKAVGAILTALGKTASAISMDPAIESEMLDAEAKAYLEMDEPERALPLAEASMALRSDSLNSKMLALEASRIIMIRCLWQQTQKQNQSINDSLELFISTASKTFPIAEQAIQAESPQGSVRAFIPSAVDNYLNSFSFLNLGDLGFSRKYPVLDSRQKEALQEISRNYWILINLCLKTYRGNQPRIDRIYYHASKTLGLCENADQAITFSKDILQNSKYGLSALQEGLVLSFERPGLFEWPQRTESLDKIKRHIDEMTRNEDAWIRLSAENAAIELYSRILNDYEQARAHCESFLNLVRQLDPFADESRFVDVEGRIEYQRFYENPKEDSSYKAKLLQDFVDYGFTRTGQTSSGMQFQLAGAVAYVAGQKILGNKGQEAAALLQLAYSKIKAREAGLRMEDILKQFRAKYPDLFADDDIKRNSYRMTPVYSLKESNSAIHFRRLSMDDRSARAIVYSDGLDLKSAQFGIIKLSEDKFEPISSQLLPYKIQFAPNGSEADSDYLISGPAVAMNREKYYLGFPQSGIIVIEKDGKSKLINEENGLATNCIRTLEPLDGKLFALIGGTVSFIRSADSGIMELNPETGVSTILYSSKSKDLKGEIDGKIISGLAAEPERHALWIVSRNEGEHNKIYQYYPDDKKLVQVENRSIQQALRCATDSREFNPVRKVGSRIVSANIFRSWMYDIKEEEATLLLDYAEKPKQIPKGYLCIPKWYKYALTSERTPRRLIPLNEDLISLSQTELLYFHKNIDKPEHLENELPADVFGNKEIRDIGLTGQGLLILTDDTLYLMPDIVEKGVQ
jgi:hypothetical protein